MVENPTTLVARMRARFAARKIQGEKGLALLDVLIGMAIFALIAIIAVSAISQYRARAYESGAVSDARAVGVALEAQFTDNAAYPADPAGALAAFQDEGGNLTDNNSIATFVSAGGAGAAQTFTFCVEHQDGAFAVYDSAEGGIVDRGREGGCA